MADLKTVRVSDPSVSKQGMATHKVVAPAKVADNTTSTLFERDAWMTLHHPPSDYSHHEALLLCETIPGEWVSWVPGYGEITLQLSQFA